MNRETYEKIADALAAQMKAARHPASHYLIVPDETNRETWELLVYDELGNLSPKLMRQAAEILNPLPAVESRQRKAQLDQAARDRLQGMFDEIGEQSPVSLKENRDSLASILRAARQRLLL